MRPLRDFGIWSRNLHLNDKELNNSFRGDIGEGALDVDGDINQSPLAKGLEPKFKDVIISSRTIDVGDLQYLKVYSTYALEIENEIPLKPSDKLKEFGDTVVAFINFEEFIKRMIRKHIDVDGEHLLILLDRVEYYNLLENKKLTTFIQQIRFIFLAK